MRQPEEGLRTIFKEVLQARKDLSENEGVSKSRGHVRDPSRKDK